MSGVYGTTYKDSPIVKRFVEPLRNDLAGLFTASSLSAYSVTLHARSPYVLGMMLGIIMYNCTHQGISFQSMEIYTKELRLKIHVQKHDELNENLLKWY